VLDRYHHDPGRQDRPLCDRWVTLALIFWQPLLVIAL
jgi:hypothetical protein